MKMKNILKKDHATVAIISMALLGLSGCIPNPEKNHVPTVTASSNHVPTITIPSNQMVHTGEVLILKATASDMDKGDKLTYLWKIAGKPKGSQLTLTEEDKRKKTISITTDKDGAYYFDFVADDGSVYSKVKRVTVTANTIVGDWTADLTKTKTENKLNDSEINEVVEALSSNYKITFLKDGKIESDTASSWRYNQNGNYTIDDTKDLKQINQHELFITNQLKDGKEVNFYYKRALKK